MLFNAVIAALSGILAQMCAFFQVAAKLQRNDILNKMDAFVDINALNRIEIPIEDRTWKSEKKITIGLRSA